ncbi:hypothetical protein [Mycobacterium marseillense]|uniref:hypothetical protein n=1 Tax=Mycobacterium marseillense TaxID=701042 RepID=UPI0011A5FB68|nr:hypothetical protein [Mycobacterium marseillense]
MSGTARRTHRHDRALTALLVSAAVALGSGAPGAAPAGADPNPYGTLSSGCQQKAPADRDAIIQGIRRGLSQWPAPAPHTSARTTCDVRPTRAAS